MGQAVAGGGSQEDWKGRIGAWGAKTVWRHACRMWIEGLRLAPSIWKIMSFVSFSLWQVASPRCS